MKRYKIIHRTYYNYTDTVILGAHHLLLRPREDHELRIESFVLKCTPEAKVFWHRDVEGNSVATANFSHSTQQLIIESEVIIQQYNEYPLDFIVDRYAVNYPFQYESSDRFLLSPYMVLPDETTRALLNNWICNVWKSGEEIQTYTLLNRLSAYIYQTLTYKVREEPGVQTAQETLTLGSGSCRDFALLVYGSSQMLGVGLTFCERVSSCTSYVFIGWLYSCMG